MQFAVEDGLKYKNILLIRKLHFSTDYLFIIQLILVDISNKHYQDFLKSFKCINKPTTKIEKIPKQVSRKNLKVKYFFMVKRL